jgi:hypothetical protein
MIKYFVSFNTLSIEMSNQSFICESDNHGIGCGPPGCICIKLRSKKNEIDCSYIGEIHKSNPDSSREVSEIDEFIDKVKHNIDTAIFTINMAEKPLSEIADFLRYSYQKLKYQNHFRINQWLYKWRRRQ